MCELGAGLPCKHSMRSECKQLERDLKCQELIVQVLKMGETVGSRGQLLHRLRVHRYADIGNMRVCVLLEQEK